MASNLYFNNTINVTTEGLQFSLSGTAVSAVPEVGPLASGTVLVLLGAGAALLRKHRKRRNR
ncbi:MAG: hypothetical protein U0835_21730 [Isosphaeraceae bacterium]